MEWHSRVDVLVCGVLDVRWYIESCSCLVMVWDMNFWQQHVSSYRPPKCGWRLRPWTTGRPMREPVVFLWARSIWMPSSDWERCWKVRLLLMQTLLYCSFEVVPSPPRIKLYERSLAFMPTSGRPSTLRARRHFFPPRIWWWYERTLKACTLERSIGKVKRGKVQLQHVGLPERELCGWLALPLTSRQNMGEKRWQCLELCFGMVWLILIHPFLVFLFG